MKIWHSQQVDQIVVPSEIDSVKGYKFHSKSESKDGASCSRAKSRSVDQSFHLNNPFADLDIISRVTTSHGNVAKREDSSSSNSETPTMSSPIKQQQSTVKKQESISYTVKDNDTITSVSASFDITPSELIKTNRLSTRTIFPGQVLRIPPKSKLSTPNNSPIKTSGSHDGNGRSGTGLGAGTGSLTGNYPGSASKNESSRKFIKINVKHITDGNGVVSGTLLVTPNAVMFDPNVSDPLVLEQGAETYGVILPLEIIVHSGIYSDIAFMRVKGKDFVPPGPKPDLYPHDSSAVSKEEAPAAPTTTSTASASTATTTTNTIESQIGESTNIETNSKELAENLEESTNISAVATTTPIVAALTTTSTVQPLGTDLENIQDSGFETGRPSPAIPNEDLVTLQQPEESRKQKVLKRLSFPLAWMESLGGQAAKEETQSAPPESKINYRSLVSLDDMPDLFASIDKLIPRPLGSTRDSEDYPPWYLCLTMGKPKHRKIKSLIVSYGQKKCIKPEYWFSIPRNQVDDLYKFWMLWWPHLYGELDPHMVDERGYELVDWDTDLFSATNDDNDQPSDDKIEDSNSAFDSLAMKGEQLGELTKESWEVVSMSDELRRALYGSEELIPELIGDSEILLEDDIKNLGKNLTARAEGYPWLLAFSTSRDGFSLNSLYRKMQGVESPVLILVQDTKQRVFGALVSCALHVSDHFYGTGQSFLFTCRPNFHVFKWTGENMYFIKGNYESLSVGAGDGKFGLWLDGDFVMIERIAILIKLGITCPGQNSQEKSHLAVLCI
ncbi:unnamed protein product [Allacma fusca]|uniref:Oxidation resistance protein 1 n=1 Tax=Allacma fusca TaxID=39272 RepID=A0A8J2LNT2_9HEXA|nr:unnamed protein product [Allacma fusca]